MELLERVSVFRKVSMSCVLYRRRNPGWLLRWPPLPDPLLQRRRGGNPTLRQLAATNGMRATSNLKHAEERCVLWRSHSRACGLRSLRHGREMIGKPTGSHLSDGSQRARFLEEMRGLWHDP
jgi:hypothetical protein